MKGKLSNQEKQDIRFSWYRRKKLKQAMKDSSLESLAKKYGVHRRTIQRAINEEPITINTEGTEENGNFNN